LMKVSGLEVDCLEKSELVDQLLQACPVHGPCMVPPAHLMAALEGCMGPQAWQGLQKASEELMPVMQQVGQAVMESLCGAMQQQDQQQPAELKQGGKVRAVASSGRAITVTEVPGVGQRCHLDRGYTFTDLGDFTQPNMLYLMTSNSDKTTPANQVMWSLHTAVPVTVHINFRSQQHAAAAKAWLQAQGWGLNLLTRSTVSTGIPNGPYSGPVYSKQCTAGQVDLMGSNCKEGTYLVFVEIPTSAPKAAPQPASDSKPELHQNQQPQSPAMTPEAAAAPVAVAATNVQTQPASSLEQEPQQPKQQLTPMQQLQEMGHSDEALNQMVLDASSADVAQAVTKLQLLQGWVPQLQQLQEMGLNDTVKLSELLLKHQGSTNLVVRELLQARAA